VAINDAHTVNMVSVAKMDIKIKIMYNADAMPCVGIIKSSEKMTTATSIP
jgi:hypothetical protein